MRRFRAGFASVTCLVAALFGGPGITLLEGVAHARLDAAGHGRQAHFEAAGTQDHDDRCQLWCRAANESTAPVRVPAIRAAPVAVSQVWAGHAVLIPRLLNRYPPSRGPPVRA